ncbi:MAG: hypothetical protein CVV21_12535 [Candidatus Goldiibacteriota bacterium HGW-Goldbacteria-1]|jgi:hypothetical protein|nr:MAG: hypothetical protein CVV21_12535 [Candidatus Goldiibacteriota bacterium HGW-Goldbacteria-1]
MKFNFIKIPGIRDNKEEGMKKITAMAAAVMFVFSGLVFAAEPFIVDDFEDGNVQTVKGGWWYTYNDANAGGNSEVWPAQGKFELSKPGADGKGYAARMKGTAGNKLGWDFVGMGATLSLNSGCPTAEPVDLKMYTTLQFKIKGNVSGGRLTVVIPYTAGTCEQGSDGPKSLTDWADYECGITSKVSEGWTTVKLDLRKDFKQPKWVKKENVAAIDKVLENAHNISFHFSSPDGDNMDIWVDDIQFN